jgi:hypothetical protein
VQAFPGFPPEMNLRGDKTDKQTNSLANLVYYDDDVYKARNS